MFESRLVYNYLFCVRHVARACDFPSPIFTFCTNSDVSLVFVLHPPLHMTTQFTRADVSSRICQGAAIFIYRGKVINATAWEKHHPGGALAIQHFVGRDATDEIEAYHSPAALAKIVKYAIGTVDVDATTGWRPLTPPIALGLRHVGNGQWKREGAVRLAEGRPYESLLPNDLEIASTMDMSVEKERSVAYHALKSRIQAAGLFGRPGPLCGYGSDLLRYALLGCLAFGLHLR